MSSYLKVASQKLEPIQEEVTTDNDVEEVDNWMENFLYHPGYDTFDEKYLEHIENINKMIEDYCYQHMVTMYQYGNAGKLRDLIYRTNPVILEECFQKAEDDVKNRIAEEEDDEEDQLEAYDEYWY